jgi:hypothetical protein
MKKLIKILSWCKNTKKEPKLKAQVKKEEPEFLDVPFERKGPIKEIQDHKLPKNSLLPEGNAIKEVTWNNN